MRKSELVFAVGVLAFGGLFLVESLRSLPYVVEEVPGPGFLPMWISLGIIAAGFGLIIPLFRSPSAASIAKPKPSGSRSWRGMGMLFGGLALSVALLESLGFLVTSTLYVGIVAYGLGMRSWRVLLVVPVLACAVLFAVFAVWLKVPLPAGILAGIGW